MHMTDNEGKTCDAVVRFLENWTGETRTNIRYPEKDRNGPLVDLRLKLGAQEYAFEHTRIEPFENHINTGVVFNKINDYIKQKLSDKLPKPAYYELRVPVDVCLPEKKSKLVLNNLIEWIRTNVQCLHDRNSNQFEPSRSRYQYDDCIHGKPIGLNCTVEILRWPDAAFLGEKPGYLGTRLICPDALEVLRTERLSRAFIDKCPKLHFCKKEGARTILILENIDIAITSLDLVGAQLPVLLAERSDVPDEIFLVETYRNPWWVWLMKCDDEYWPEVDMPTRNQFFYFQDKLASTGIPKWYRNSLRVNQIYRPNFQGWSPKTFEEDELNDLTIG